MVAAGRPVSSDSYRPWHAVVLAALLALAPVAPVRADTGIEQAEDFTITMSGSEKARVTTGGNVGIGTTSPAAQLHLAGAKSATSWTTTGIVLRQDAATYTDTSSAGSVSNVSLSNFAGGTISASSAVTYSNAYTLSIQAPPVAGTNVTIQRAYGLVVTANSRFNGNASFGNTTNTTSVVDIGGNQSSSSWTTSGPNLNVEANTLTATTGTGTVATRVANAFGQPTLASSNAVTVTNAANVYIADAPAAGTNTTLTSAWALYGAAGNMYWAGNILQAASAYHNFGTTVGTSGYGVRDNAGTIEYKNSGGSWTALNASSTVMATGSVTAPGLAFSGDSDTGFYQATANTLSVTAGSVEAMRFETATSGVNYFDVTPAAAGGSPTIAVAGSDTDIGIKMTPKGAGNVLVTSGNVGIGTTSPGTMLDVYRSDSANGSFGATGYPGLRVINTNATAGDPNAGSPTYNRAEARVSAGNNSVYGGLLATYETTGGFSSALALRVVTAHPLTFYTNNSERMRIDSSGNVGIGVSSPAARVNLGGSVSATSWTTTGINLAANASTYTDTSGTGTISTRAVNSFGTPTLASSSAVTVTNAANVYIAGAPAAGTNTTITNAYALHINTGNARLDGFNSFGGVGTPAAVVNIGGNQSSAAWGTSGLNFRVIANTLTDTSSSGTVANVAANSFGQPTLAASSATTYTGAATLLISSSPTAGSNVTITNPYSLWINGGNTRLDGWSSFGSVAAPAAVVHIGGNQSSAAWTTVGLNLRVAANTLTDTSSSGTVAAVAANAIAQPTLAASSSTTYTNAANLYVANAPTAGTNVTLTNAWALYMAAGNMYTAGNILQAASAYHNFGTTVGSSGYGIRDNAGTMEFKNSGGGWTALGYTSTMSTGSVSAAGLAFTGDADTGLYQAAANALSVTAGSVEAMRFETAASGVNYFDITPAAAGASPIIGVAGSDSNIGIKLTPKGSGNLLVTSGSVGIGTTSAGAKLDVNGGVKVGDNAGSCTSTNNGEIRYTSGNSPPYNYCNGSAWLPFENAGFVPAYTKFTAASISAGGSYFMTALKSDGTLWGWGYNGYGNIGDGTTTTRTVPTVSAAAFAGPWSAVAAGYITTCAIKSSDSSLWCWGYNGTGAVGDGTTTSRTSSPVQVSGTWAQVSGGGDGGGTYTVTLSATYYTCGVKSDNTGWCWGSNGSGNLGDGTTTQRTSPVQVTGTWSSINVGQGYHTCGIKTDNTLWCWGYNGYGQLGIGNTTDASTPQQVSGSWTSVTIGNTHTCAIKSDGTLWCWGRNGNGQLGDNSTTNRSSPVQVNGGGTWSKVGSNDISTCGIKTDGTLWCWGYNVYGQVPGAAPNSSIKVPTAAPASSVVTGSNWSDVVGGLSYMCGRRDNSTVYCWGSPTYGVLGNGQFGGILPASGS
jgi:alpha-tubulin suppressor-like RCC1 family protein